MFDTSSPAGREPVASALLTELQSAEAALARAEAAELAGRPVGELLDAVPRCDRLITRLQLLSARVLAAVPVEPEPTTVEGFAARTSDPGEVTPHELGLVLKVSADSVRNRLFLAGTVVHELPAVSAAAADGCLKWWQVRDTVEAVTGLSPEAVAQVDARLADAARAGRCRSRFTATVQRIVIAADPAKAEQRRAAGLADRRIWFKPVGDGMTAFGGLLAAENAVTLAACLTRLAPTPIAAPPVTCDAGGRTLTQARVDALAGLADRVLDHLLDPPPVPAPKTPPLPTRASPTPAVPGAADSDVDTARAARAARRRARRARRRAARQEDRLAESSPA